MTTDNSPEQPFSQKFQHNPIAARVPEKIAAGVFSTGALVQTLANEFLIDFVQNLSRPPSVVARLIVSPQTLAQMSQAVQNNLNMYSQKFGAPPPLPKPVNPRRPTIQEIYDELKLPEELMGGSYANTLMVGHSPAEFVLDFITNFYPKAAVTSRIFISAPQIPRLLETWAQAMKNFQTRGNPPPIEGGPPTSPPEPPISHPPI
jgi:hypothetical protein